MGAAPATTEDESSTGDDDDVQAELAELDTRQQSDDAERRALAEALIARGDAASLAAAAMIHHALQDFGGSGELIRRAAEVAPAAHVAWLELCMCLDRALCDPAPVARRLANVDPGNGAALLHEFPAENAPDAEMNAFLLRLAGAERIDTYWNQLLVSAFDAIEAIDGRKLGALDDETAPYDGRSDVVGVLAATTLLDVTPLTSVCSEAAVADSTRRNLCQRVGRALQNGDTILAEMIGLLLERRTWPSGSREHRAVLERRAALSAVSLDSSREGGDALWSERSIQTMRAHRTEQNARRALSALYAGKPARAFDKNPFTTVRATTATALTDEAATAADEAMSSGAKSTTNGAAGEGRTMHLQPLDVNFLAVLVAGASAFLLGGLWYSNALFGLTWNREAGLPVEKRPHRPQVFATGFVLSLIAAWLFAAILPASVTIAQATLFGAIVGAAWVATSFGINYGFGDRSLKLWLIDGGYHTLQFALYGVILAAWR
jgi:Protein of unknown function (DUF1761)